MNLVLIYDNKIPYLQTQTLLSSGPDLCFHALRGNFSLSFFSFSFSFFSFRPGNLNQGQGPSIIVVVVVVVVVVVIVFLFIALFQQIIPSSSDSPIAEEVEEIVVGLPDEAVVLDCSMDANPAPTYEWSFTPKDSDYAR